MSYGKLIFKRLYAVSIELKISNRTKMHTMRCPWQSFRINHEKQPVVSLMTSTEKKNVYLKLIQKYVYIQDTKHHWSSYHIPGRTSWMVRLQTSCNLYMESIKTYFNSAVVTVYFSNLYWSHFSVITIDLPEKLTVLRRRLAGLLSLHLHMLGISKNYEVCIEAIETVTLTSVEVNTPSYLCSSDSPKRILDTFES